MEKLTGRLKREHDTLVRMTVIYCRDLHGQTDDWLCEDCHELMKYAYRRLAKCPYGDAKPTCANCPIHCYKKVQRQKVREVMRYAGPRMMRHHPLDAIIHMFDKLRKAVHPRELRAKREKKAREKKG